MEFHVNPAELIAVSGGILIILVPVLGATIRATARPLIEVLVAAGLVGKKEEASSAEVARLSRRVTELEQEVDRLKVNSLPSIAPVDTRRIHS